MEQLLSPLVFNGSTVEAITEAKQKKKLFVVLVSGGNMESNQSETSTWLDPRVADSISKYCILLHILEGSTDARNFSALYPQEAIPCITVIGYNGVQLWQHGGFVSAENLASSLEKAWLSLHVQDTTTTLLTAALASRKDLVSGASSVTAEVGSSSSAQVSPAQAITHIQSPLATLSKNSQIVEGEDPGHAAMDIDSSLIDMDSHGSADAFESRIGDFNESTTVITTAEKPLDLVEVDSNKGKDECSMSKENPGLRDQHLDPSDEAPREIANKAGKDPEINIVEDAAAESDDSSNIFHDVCLNIRLPDGSSLQVKFLVVDTLRMVKHYVDKNQTSSIGYYDLAVPYPRKVFGDEDLDRTLSDLGLHNRQALIIVLRNKVDVTSLHGLNNPAESNHTTIGGDAGYFATIRKLFSYVNPLSYLGGSSNTSNTARDSIWQYGPNSSTPQNNQSLVSKTSTTNNRGRKRASSSFGSNIHTLKHDEDENQSGDKNTFWNDDFGSHASSEFSNTRVSENSKKLNVCASETQESNTHDESIKKNDEEKKDDGSVRCSLKIEVIDDTAMIDISQVGKSCSIDKNFDGKSGRNRKKKNANQMVTVKAKDRKIEEKNVNGGCKINGGEEKRVYCRKELENLRFVGMEQQRKMWVELYCGLGDTVQKEYDGLVDSNTQKHIRLSRSRRHIGKENTPVISGVLAAKERGKHMKVYTQRGMTYMNLQNTLCLPGH